MNNEIGRLEIALVHLQQALDAELSQVSPNVRAAMSQIEHYLNAEKETDSLVWCDSCNKGSTTWVDCDLHLDVECFQEICDYCGTALYRDCEGVEK